MTQAFQIGPGQTGETITRPIWSGGRETNGSDSPVIVSAFPLNPDDYVLAGATVSFELLAVVANGNTPLSSHLHLYNLTDAEVVATSVIDIIDSTTPSKYTAALTIGTGAGELKSGAEKLYECRIFLDAPPGGGLDTIELFQAELRAIFTIL